MSGEIILREEKGSQLTIAEMDNNFRVLDSRVPDHEAASDPHPQYLNTERLPAALGESIQDAMNTPLTGGTHDGVGVSYNDAANRFIFTNLDKGSAAVSAHLNATDPHGDRADTDAKIAAHSNANDPHGDRAAISGRIAEHVFANDPHGDRAAAVTIASAAVADHSAASDPHGDRAAANAALSNHANGTDPHGDRADAAAKVASHAAASDPHADRAYSDDQLSGHVVATDPHGDRAAASAALSIHTSNANNPHGVTKAQVGLGNADNTADSEKPVSAAQASAIASAVSAHAAAADPHTQYAHESDVANELIQMAASITQTQTQVAESFSETQDALQDTSESSVLVSGTTTPRKLRARFADSISIKDFGAIGDGVADDSAEEDAAHAFAAGRAIEYPPPASSYLNTDSSFNLYGSSSYKAAGWKRVQSGLNAAPINKPEPVLWTQKFSNADRALNPAAWDQVSYAGLIKKGGNAYGAALTGYGLYQGGSGDLVGVHGRVKSQADGSRNYAGWFYVEVDTAAPTASHGLELNGRNNIADPGYDGLAQLLRLCMADNTSALNRFSTALSIGKTTVGGDNGFWKGIDFEVDAIIATAADLADGEAIKLRGPAVNSIGGFRFGAGRYKYALRLDEGTFVNNNALLLATGQNIRWGSLTAGSRITADSNRLVVGNASFGLSGNLSRNFWGVTGIGLSIDALSYNDANSSGSNASNLAVHAIAAPTITATTPTTYSAIQSTLYIAGAPAAGPGVTLAAARALHVAAGGAVVNGPTNINANNNNGTNINTGSSTSSLNLGGPSALLGFHGATAVSKQTISGSRSNPESALAAALVALHNLGLINNTTTA